MISIGISIGTVRGTLGAFCAITHSGDLIRLEGLPFTAGEHGLRWLEAAKFTQLLCDVLTDWPANVLIDPYGSRERPFETGVHIGEVYALSQRVSGLKVRLVGRSSVREYMGSDHNAWVSRAHQQFPDAAILRPEGAGAWDSFARARALLLAEHDRSSAGRARSAMNEKVG